VKILTWITCSLLAVSCYGINAPVVVDRTTHLITWPTDFIDLNFGYLDESFNAMSNNVTASTNWVADQLDGISTDIYLELYGDLNASVLALSTNHNTTLNTVNTNLLNQIDIVDTDLTADITALDIELSADINTVDTNSTAQLYIVNTNLTAEIGTLDVKLSADINTVDTNLTSEINIVDTNSTAQLYIVNTNLTAEIALFTESTVNYFTASNTFLSFAGLRSSAIVTTNITSIDFGPPVVTNFSYTTTYDFYPFVTKSITNALYAIVTGKVDSIDFIASTNALTVSIATKVDSSDYVIHTNAVAVSTNAIVVDLATKTTYAETTNIANNAVSDYDSTNNFVKAPGITNIADNAVWEYASTNNFVTAPIVTNIAENAIADYTNTINVITTDEDGRVIPSTFFDDNGVVRTNGISGYVTEASSPNYDVNTTSYFFGAENATGYSITTNTEGYVGSITTNAATTNYNMGSIYFSFDTGTSNYNTFASAWSLSTNVYMFWDDVDTYEQGAIPLNFGNLLKESTNPQRWASQIRAAVDATQFVDFQAVSNSFVTSVYPPTNGLLYGTTSVYTNTALLYSFDDIAAVLWNPTNSPSTTITNTTYTTNWVATVDTNITYSPLVNESALADEGFATTQFVNSAIAPLATSTELDAVASAGTNYAQMVALYGSNYVEKLEQYGTLDITITPDSAWTFDGSGTITAYSGSYTDVVIPYEIGGVAVTNIGDMLFETDTNVESIIAGKNLISIGSDFSGACDALVSITLPSVISVGDSFASGCASLNSVSLSCEAPTVGLTPYLTSLNVTNYVLNATATGWSDTFGGKPVVFPSHTLEDVEIKGDATINGVGIATITITNGIATTQFVDSAIAGIDTSDLASTSYVNSAISPLASTTYVDESIDNQAEIDKTNSYTIITKDYLVLADHAWENEGFVNPVQLDYLGAMTNEAGSGRLTWVSSTNIFMFMSGDYQWYLSDAPLSLTNMWTNSYFAWDLTTIKQTPSTKVFYNYVDTGKLVDTNALNSAIAGIDIPPANFFNAITNVAGTTITLSTNQIAYAIDITNDTTIIFPATTGMAGSLFLRIGMDAVYDVTWSNAPLARNIEYAATNYYNFVGTDDGIGWTVTPISARAK